MAQPQTQWYSSYVQAVPPHELQQITQWFQTVDSNRSGQVDVNELQRCLSLGGMQFNIEVTRKIMGLFDTDRSGQIGLNEFIGMHKYLQAMRESFMFFDKDRSGSLDQNEFYQALLRSGFQLSGPAFQNVLAKVDKNRGGSISFDEYIDASLLLSNLRRYFGYYDVRRQNVIQLNFDQFVMAIPFFQ